MARHPRPAPGPWRALLLVVMGLSACTDPYPFEPDNVSTSAALTSEASVAGLMAFTTACATCHASRDAFDLAAFQFADRDILRRAVFHVDSATANQIVRYVRSLQVPAVPRHHRPFQVPRVATDVDFARHLFGGDRWPVALNEAALLRIDPTTVAAAVNFPTWSDEQSDLDWMGNAPLPTHVLQFNDGMPQRALDAYYADRTDARLLAAISRLRSAIFHAESGSCAQVNDGQLSAPDDCFDQLRWISNLGAQHVLRRGMTAEALPTTSTLVQNTWWDVGQAARRSLIKNKAPVPQAEENWVSWMYLGWVLAPQSRASVYTASGLSRVGLPRHATFVAMRSMVARPAMSPSAYADLNTAFQFAPSGWVEGVAGTALAVLSERHARGWAPTSDKGRSDARDSLVKASATLVRRLGATRASPLIAQIDALAAAL